MTLSVLALAAPIALAAAVEPGWLWTRTCWTAPAAAGTDSLGTKTRPEPDSAGARSHAAAAWRAPDTLQPEGGLGSTRRLRVYRGGLPQLIDQDYRIAPGDSLVLLAASMLPGESLCLERASTPLMANPAFGLYRMDNVPVFKSGSLDSAWEAGVHLTLQPEDTAYSKYRLNYSGSKSMAVTVGSGGGLGLDASLFINLNGQVAEDVFVEGQLSDQNVPIQPEGNTATLKEVDTKYMKVFGSHYSYTLGNYLMDYGAAGEDRFTAKVQGVDGAYFRNGYAIHGAWSLSDGQYQSDTLRGVDGKQRGYYLRGRDGRQFITVLAGTERVWRNGAPLKRGQDYTIDYSDGRLDFLSPMVVTSENLFSAEFQYTEQDFQRSLSAGEVRDSSGALTWSLRAISELENKDHPLSLVLDSTLRRRFAGLGDSLYVDSGRVIAMPHRQSAAAADLALKFFGYDGRGALLFSQLDRNLYSDKDDNDNLGFSTRYLGTHTLGKPISSGGFGKTDLTLDHEFRAAHYESFKQLIEPRGFLETWNLDSRVAQRGFMANRLTLEERPFSRLLLGGEVGRADADAAADTANPNAAEGSQSRRAAVSAHLGGEKTFFETATESKLARSPDRRDNYRQYGSLHWEAAGVSPSFTWIRNEWLADLPGGMLSRSEKQEPEFALTTVPFWGRVAFTTGLSALSQRANFDGRLAELQDSVRDWGVSQKVSAAGLGPWNTDVFYSYRNHRQWRLDGTGTYANIPEESDFNQAEWNSQLSDRRKGYALTSSYRISQTAEFPLVEDFRELKGRGDYVYDSVLNAYNKVETGGDFVLIGLKRDTTIGSRPYQDLSWSSNLQLTPAKFPFPVSGILADIELSLDLALDNQDTSANPGLLPLLTDDQIDRVRSGRARYSPALHWKSPAGGKAANLYVDRSYSRAAGIYAFRERLWNERGDFRREVGEDWEYYLEQSYENRFREGATGGSAGETRNENYVYGTRVTRKLPWTLMAEGRAQYLTIKGNSYSGVTDLQGVKPALKLEKSSLYNGRAFLEYGLIYFWGQGEGSFYSTGDFAKGLTHRAEANANFQVGQNIYLNFDYVIRLEPGGNKLVQKMTAEARAVF
ncbi:MAG: hypothetical protein JWO30_2481 [Fibrobacteres bacterium]|nr:hypothetical protein [Fibrobacterota bacterium]